MKHSRLAILCAASATIAFLVRFSFPEKVPNDRPEKQIGTNASAMRLVERTFSMDQCVAAYRQIKGVSNGMRQSVALADLFDSVPASEFRDLLSRLQGEEMLANTYYHLYASWFKKSGGTALEHLAQSNLPAKATILMILLEPWSKREPKAAEIWVQSAPPSVRELVQNQRKRPASSPATPSERFWAMGDSGQWKGDFLRAFRDWFRADSAGAMTEMLRSPALSKDPRYLAIVHEEIASKSPRDAESFLRSLNPNVFRNVNAELVSKIAISNSAIAQGIAEKMPTPRERAWVLAAAAKVVTDKNPSEAPA